MKKWLIFSVVFIVLCQGKTDQKKTAHKEPTIRVLLEHASNTKKISVMINGSYQLFNGNNKVIAQGQSLTITSVKATEEGISLGEHAFKQTKLIFSPQKNAHIVVNKIAYAGEIRVIQRKGQLRTLNVLSIERYLAGVIGGEMPLTWPDAALSAQAICARTYALYEKGQNTEKLFDVYDTTRSQVYKGIQVESPRSHAIIEITRGIVMLYNNRVFKAFFHSTCGGHTARVRDVFPEYPDILPLSGRTCPYCKGSKYSSWQCSLNLADLTTLLLELKAKLPFVKMMPGQKDKGNRFVSVKIYHGQNHVSTVPAALLREKIKTQGKLLRSCKFTIENYEDGIVLSGAGWGHGVGMCQVGASNMAKRGHNSLDILRFYYPTVNIYRIWN